MPFIPEHRSKKPPTPDETLRGLELNNNEGSKREKFRPVTPGEVKFDATPLTDAEIRRAFGGIGAQLPKDGLKQGAPQPPQVRGGFLDRLANAKQEEERARAAALEELRQQQLREAQVPHAELKKRALQHRQASGVGLLVRRLGEILAADRVAAYYTLWGTNRTRAGDFSSMSTIKDDIYQVPNPVAGTFSRGISKGPDYDVTPYGRGTSNPLEYPIVQPTNKDSAVDIAVWDSANNGEKTVWDRDFVGQRKDSALEWTEHEVKYLFVETRPDGIITFHGNTMRSITEQTWIARYEEMQRKRDNWHGGPAPFFGILKTPITEQTWKAQASELDEALEEAFNSPKMYTFETNKRYADRNRSSTYPAWGRSRGPGG